jgi:hypothetical protein
MGQDPALQKDFWNLEVDVQGVTASLLPPGPLKESISVFQGAMSLANGTLSGDEIAYQDAQIAQRQEELEAQYINDLQQQVAAGPAPASTLDGIFDSNVGAAVANNNLSIPPINLSLGTAANSSNPQLDFVYPDGSKDLFTTYNSAQNLFSGSQNPGAGFTVDLTHFNSLGSPTIDTTLKIETATSGTGGSGIALTGATLSSQYFYQSNVTGSSTMSTDGTGSISRVGGPTLNYGATTEADPSVDANGDMSATLTTSSLLTPETFDLTANGVNLDTGGNNFSFLAPDADVTIASSGNASFTSSILGNGSSPLTLSVTGSAEFTTGEGSVVQLAPWLLDAVSQNGDGGINLALNPGIAGAAETAQVDPATGNTVLNYTDAAGDTTTAVLDVPDGDTVNLDGLTASIVDAAGQELSQAVLSADGVTTDIYNSVTGLISQSISDDTLTGAVTQAFYDAAGSPILSAVYQGGNPASLDVSGDPDYTQLAGPLANVLSAGVFSALLFAHNQPASLLTESLVTAATDELTNDASFDAMDFSTKTAANLTSMAGSLVESKLSADLLKSLGITSPLGTAVGNAVTTAATQELASYAVSAIAGIDVQPEELVADFVSSLGSGLQQVGLNYATAFATTTLDKLLEPDGNPQGEAIGGSIGGAIGAVMGDVFGGPIGGTIGQVLGKIAGSLFGGLLGGGTSVGPDGNVVIAFDYQTQAFYIKNVGQDNGLNPSVLWSMGTAIINALNVIVTLTGGQVTGPIQEFTVGWIGGEFFQVAGDQSPQDSFPNRSPTPEGAIDFAFTAVLPQLAEATEDGNPFVKAAILSSQSSTESGLTADIGAGYDYGSYDSNTAGFLATILASDDPGASWASWKAEQARAQALGLERFTLATNGQLVFSDTADSATDNLDLLQNLGSSLGSINLTSGSVLNLGANQATRDMSALSKIDEPFQVVITDILANIQANFGTWVELAQTENLAAINITDSGRPVLSLSIAQIIESQNARAAITGPYGITIDDTFANILANINLVASLASQGLLEATPLTDQSLTITASGGTYTYNGISFVVTGSSDTIGANNSNLIDGGNLNGIYINFGTLIIDAHKTTWVYGAYNDIYAGYNSILTVTGRDDNVWMNSGSLSVDPGEVIQVTGAAITINAPGDQVHLMTAGAANTVYGSYTTIDAADASTVTDYGPNNGVVMNGGDVFVDAGQTLYLTGIYDTVTNAGGAVHFQTGEATDTIDGNNTVSYVDQDVVTLNVNGPSNTVYMSDGFINLAAGGTLQLIGDYTSVYMVAGSTVNVDGKNNGMYMNGGTVNAQPGLTVWASIAGSNNVFVMNSGTLNINQDQSFEVYGTGNLLNAAGDNIQITSAGSENVDHGGDNTFTSTTNITITAFGDNNTASLGAGSVFIDNFSLGGSMVETFAPSAGITSIVRSYSGAGGTGGVVATTLTGSVQGILATVGSLQGAVQLNVVDTFTNVQAARDTLQFLTSDDILNIQLTDAIEPTLRMPLIQAFDEAGVFADISSPFERGFPIVAGSQPAGTTTSGPPFVHFEGWAAAAVTAAIPQPHQSTGIMFAHLQPS